MPNQSLADDLRQAADKIEEMVAGSKFAVKGEANVYFHTTLADEFVALFRLLGGTREKHESGNTLWCTCKLGMVRITIFAPSREAVCTKLVTGTRMVPEMTERATGRMIEEEIIEWDCPDSILSIGERA